MCKKLICAFALILGLAVGGAAQADLASWEASIGAASPLNWYKFNETTGTDCLDSGRGALKGVYNGATPAVEGFFGPGTGAQFTRANMTRVDFAGATDLSAPYTAEYIVKTFLAGPAAQQAQAMHDGDISGLRLAGWSALSEIGFVLYGVADYRFTPEPGFTLNDLIAPQDKWLHVTFRNNGSLMQVFVNGKLMGSQTNLVPLGRLRIGSRVGSSTSAFDGVLDEAVVFDRALSDADIIKHALAGSLLDESVLQASHPSPADGAVLSDTWVNMTWTPGAFAVSHDVYLSDNFDDVNSGAPGAFRGNQSLPTLLAGFFGYPYPDGLVPGTTYYWRIDQVEADGTIRKGKLWSFMLPPKTAYKPNPADGSRYIATDTALSWTGGLNAKLHTVYFGASFDNVNNATAGVSRTTTTYTPPGPLTKGTTYYWRVDEFDAMATYKGKVWSFTTSPDIAVTDPNLLAWWTLDEGEGINILDWSGHGHQGTLAGDAHWVDGYDLTAVQFDGAGDYVGFGTPADLHLPITYTYTAWFKPGRNIRGDSGPQYILCIGSRSDLVFGVEDSVGVNGDLSLHYYDTQPSFHAVGVGQTSWLVDEWHMVAGTKDATGHKIYLDGKLKNSDGNTNQDNFNGALTRMISLGARAWTGAQYFNGTIDDVRIYNKALTEQAIQQVMQGNALVAGDPSPARGAVVDFDTVKSLSWSAGGTAASHDVYFGKDRNAVASAGKTSPEYKGSQAGTGLSAAGLVEFGGGAYYWRIDEVEAGGTLHGGTIWKFSVPDYLTVDDIESYNDLPETDLASNRIYKAWIDGYGTTTNGAVVGNIDVPLTERRPGYVHGGLQAMPLAYDNNLKFSEATLTLTAGRDWTREGVANLSLWFRGAAASATTAANAAERMYVALNGTAVVYNTNANAAQRTAWTEWVIPLQAFADLGVNLTNVTSITIGFGTRGNTTIAGGTGQMYIDDIRLYRPTAP